MKGAGGDKYPLRVYSLGREDFGLDMRELARVILCFTYLHASDPPFAKHTSHLRAGARICSQHA